MRLFLVIQLLFFTFLFSRLYTKSIHTYLNAKFSHHSFLAQAAEFFWDVEPNLYWNFYHFIPNECNNSSSDQGDYNCSMSFCGKYMNHPFSQLLNYALSLQYYAPRIEMFHHMAEERLDTNTKLGSHDAFLDICDQHLIWSVEDIGSYLPYLSSSCFSKIYSFDHSTFNNLWSFQHSKSFKIQAILYGGLGLPNTNDFFDILIKLINKGLLGGFVFRPWYPVTKKAFDILLSGYGVELAIKSTEYLAQDDIQLNVNSKLNFTKEIIEEYISGLNFTSLILYFPDEIDNILLFQNHLNVLEKDLVSIKQWQWGDLGFQMCQSVLDRHLDKGVGALNEIIHIIQNLPVQSKNLHQLSVSEELRKEIFKNQHFLTSIGIEGGRNIAILNGKKLEELDLFKLMNIFREELFLMTSIYSAGVDPEDIFEFLQLKVNTEVVDFALDLRDLEIVFVNDIEIDTEYSLWTNNVQELLRPTFPGVIRQIRRNLFNIVIFFDPSEINTHIIMKVVNAFLSNNLPIRIGFVMKLSSPSTSDYLILSKSINACFNYICKKKSKRKALFWLQNLHEHINGLQILPTMEIVDNYCYSLTGVNASHLIKQYTNIELAEEFYQSSGLNELPSLLLNGIPIRNVFFKGASSSKIIDDIVLAINQAINHQTRILQGEVYFGKLINQMDVYQFLMTRSNVVKRLNYRILSQHFTTLNFLCFNTIPLTPLDNLDLLNDCQLSYLFSKSIPYIFNSEFELYTKPISIWLVADFSTEIGFDLFKQSLKLISRSNFSRVALISNSPLSHDLNVNKILQALVYSQSEHFLYTIFSKITYESDFSNLTTETVIGALSDYKWFKTEEFIAQVNNTNLDSNFWHFTSQVLRFRYGIRALIVNGRILGPLDLNERFVYEDFKLLEDLFNLNNGDEFLKLVDKYPFRLENGSFIDYSSSHFKSDSFLRIISSLYFKKINDIRILFPREKLSSNYSMINLKPRINNAIFLNLDLIVDPFTKEAQKLLPIALDLYNMLNIHLRLWLSPRQRISDFPVNRFYKYLINPKPIFQKNGSISTTQPFLQFIDLPTSPLLTLSLDVPHVWMVETTFSQYDLDNLHLKNVIGCVMANFQLTHILLEGSCLHYLTRNPVPGLQLTLGTKRHAQKYDSLVMANLGYFQLKSQPGVWKLELIEVGFVEPHYIFDHQGGEEIEKDGSLVVSVSDFNGIFLQLYVSKLDKIDTSNIAVSESGDSTFDKIWDSLSSFLPKNDNINAYERINSDEVINIFSIASGHLYERFLRLMMLSVLKNTQNPVKFWLLKNYFSPQFKEFIPLYAIHYNFSYELVEYKWPKWLREQDQKQRIIWGYKILFLDVLFPLNVKRMIYIDADQIVRTNLLELVYMDLKGAPYGYTPFCDSKKEMDGFRFWKQGYWQNLLRHRKYHISALYVIDLMQFRQIGAGDRLRENYQALSQDPNSLANLDQDLPNSMIHSVPIFSLPQDWLWCETWCSEDEKSRAKTIDICNNPSTKEPKLDAAKRIINEWNDYDNEIKMLYKSTQLPYHTSNFENKNRNHNHLEL